MNKDENGKDAHFELKKLIQLYENAKAAHEFVILGFRTEKQETQSGCFKPGKHRFHRRCETGAFLKQEDLFYKQVR